MARDARFVGPVERLLYLQSMPGFAALNAAELLTLAYEARERFFRKGQRLLKEGTAARSVYFLVEGRVSVRRAGRVLQLIEPPFTVGFLPVLSGSEQSVEARAESDTLTLELPAESLFDAFEDSFPLLETGVRQLARQFAELQRRLELRGLVEREPPEQTPYPDEALDLVQRLIALRKAGPYVHASLDSLAELVRHVQEVRFEPGDVLWDVGDAAEFGVHVVHGTVRCVGDDGLRVFPMGPGSVIGYSETLGRLERTYRATAESRVVGLRGSQEAFLDTLEDNFDLGRVFMSFIASVLLDLYGKLADDDASSAEAVPSLA